MNNQSGTAGNVPSGFLATDVRTSQTVPVGTSQLNPLPVSSTNYAQFLPRFFAFVIDEILAGALAGMLSAVVAGIGAVVGMAGTATRHGGLGFTIAFLLEIAAVGIGLFTYIAYFVKSETGPSQATPGKRLLGIRIVSSTGGRITVPQSLGRLLVKNLLSAILFGLGFLMAAFTERKQALHDLAAGTLVIAR